MHYLRKYVGIYRVKAEYDLDTKDFPRTETGGLDSSFDDLYIDCRNNIKIRHGIGNILSCHIPNKSRGMNVLRQIYQDKISETLPKKDDTYLSNLCTELIEKEILVSAEVLDFEVYFEFKAVEIDYIAKLVGAKTNGKSISPFSEKNLPKTPYKIPDKDMNLYKKSIENFPKKTIIIQGKERESIDGLLVSRLTKQFDEVIIKSQSKKFDINKDRKIKGLKGREYIHSFGNEMWIEFCRFLEEHSEVQNE